MIGAKEDPQTVFGKELEWVTVEQHLLVLDLRNGKIVQDVNLGPVHGPVRIEAVDERGLLLCLEGLRLAYYLRSDA